VGTVSPGGGVPEGTVTFRDAGGVIGTAAVDAAGTATLTVATLAPGAHDVVAEYGGSATHAASTSAPVTHTVGRATAAGTLTSAPNPSRSGDVVTFNATVTSTRGVPTGTVDLVEAGAVLATAALDANGAAVLSATFVVPGAHAVDLVYSGDATFLPGTVASVVQNVGAVDPVDSGPPDAGPVDAGPVDAGPVDAGPVDAGPVDAGRPDSGPADGGPVDAGPRPDGGPGDGGTGGGDAATSPDASGGNIDGGRTDGGALPPAVNPLEDADIRGSGCECGTAGTPLGDGLLAAGLGGALASLFLVRRRRSKASRPS
jgi:hypothetical protein